MTEFRLSMKKDLGLHQEVMDALPYSNVGGAAEGSLIAPVGAANVWTILNHIVPAGHQLKILFLRVWTSDAGGARFRIIQSNPTAAGLTGAVEAFPVVGSVPSGVRDYPFLEAPGAEVLHGSLEAPILVGEGSINFDLMGPTAIPATGVRYSITWWGVEDIPE